MFSVFNSLYSTSFFNFYDSCSFHIKIGPQSRRYVVFEVSSELKGKRDYFNALSKHVDNPHGRHEFYQFLMKRDISNTDWINDRPVTDFYLKMVELNLPYEHLFIKQMILSQWDTYNKDLVEMGLTKKKVPASLFIRETTTDLFQLFIGWLEGFGAKNKHTTTANKFGNKLTELVADPNKKSNMHSTFRGISKSRHGVGIKYSFDVMALLDEFVLKKWATQDEIIWV